MVTKQRHLSRLFVVCALMAVVSCGQNNVQKAEMIADAAVIDAIDTSPQEDARSNDVQIEDTQIEDVQAADADVSDTSEEADTAPSDAAMLDDTSDEEVFDAALEDVSEEDTALEDTQSDDVSAEDGALDSSIEPEPVPGANTNALFPIDRGDDSEHTPGSYLGLPLRLVDNGEPGIEAVDGAIGVVCVGMSSSNQECSAFINARQNELMDTINHQVVIVNCAVRRHAIEEWGDPAYDGILWRACVGHKLAAIGLRIDQVRVIYHRASNEHTVPDVTYPEPGSDYETFQTNLTRFAERVKGFFPNVQAVYTAPRSYGGFATRAGRGEPLSYESGHALNTWLRNNPENDGVWYGWGPYLWAPDCTDGTTNASGVCYERGDYQADGTHLTQDGNDKTVSMIHARFSEHAWYRPCAGCPAPVLMPEMCTADIDCDDDDPCTLDQCNTETGQCRVRRVPRCTSSDACEPSDPCDDGELCTTDRCVELTCQHRTNNSCVNRFCDTHADCDTRCERFDTGCVCVAQQCTVICASNADCPRNSPRCVDGLCGSR